MKLASIEPFVGTPETDIERELAVESVEKEAASVPKIRKEAAEQEISRDDPQSSKGGFERLADFLRKESVRKKSHQSRLVRANKAYNYLDDKKTTEYSIGHEVDKAA